jgi:hypothetical protein
MPDRSERWLLGNRLLVWGLVAALISDFLWAFYLAGAGYYLPHGGALDVLGLGALIVAICGAVVRAVS